MVSFKQFLIEGTLLKSNLNKKPDRLERLIQKLENGEAFVQKGQTTPSLVITPDPLWFEDLKRTRQLKTDYILDINGQKIPFNSLQKTVEFGSTGRLGTEKEGIQLNRLDELIKEAEGGEPIDIKVGDKIYKNCTGAKNTPGTPKSDFEIINENEQSVIFISHKDGTKATDFGQWSGLTHFIDDYPEVQIFVKDVREKVGDTMPPKTTLSRKIQNDVLKNKSCFGKDYGSTGYGINNVTCILQGKIGLKKQDTYFVLEGDHLWLNGDTPKDQYTPCMMAIYKGDRDNFNIQGARFSIYPVGGRKNNPI